MSGHGALRGAFGCYAAQGSLPGAQGQGYDLNLSYSRTTLKAVADAITQQVGIAFSYETALAGYPMENLEVSEKGATIEAILAAVFTPRGIDYRVVDKVVVLTRSTRPVPAASRRQPSREVERGRPRRCGQPDDRRDGHYARGRWSASRTGVGAAAMRSRPTGTPRCSSRISATAPMRRW